MSFKKLLRLVRLELLIEWRRKAGWLNGLVFVGGVLAILHLCVRSLRVDVSSVPLWNAFFWMLILFCSVQLTSHKSLAQTRGEALFYHLMATPALRVVARMLYYFLVLLGFAVVIVVSYFSLMGNPLKQPFFFLLGVLSYCLSASMILAAVSIVVARLHVASLLHAAMGLPLLLPSLLLHLPAGLAFGYGASVREQWTHLCALFSLSVLYAALGVLLFPYLRTD